jgi:hypothetical protein
MSKEETGMYCAGLLAKAVPGQTLRGMASITAHVQAIPCHHSEQCLS